MSWDACLPTTPEGPHPRRLISFGVRDATRTGNVHASRRRRGRRNRAPMRKDVGEGVGPRGSRPDRDPCHVARNAIFTHGMRASPRCRAPGWPDEFSATMPNAARPSRRDALRSLTWRRSRRSQGRALRVSSLHATTQRHPSNVTRARHVATATQAPRASAAARRSDGRANFKRVRFQLNIQNTIIKY